MRSAPIIRRRCWRRRKPMADADARGPMLSFAGATLADAQRRAVKALLQRPSIDASVDARRLLMQTLGCDAITLVKSPERVLSPSEAELYERLLVRRLAGEPVSRIVGWRGFYGREFLITPATLDPRPESETLIEVALSAVRDLFPGGRGLDILDIGTGTGCLLLTLLAELPEATGTGIDPSAKALAVAADNARLLGVTERVRFVEGRGFAGLRQPFGLVVSNPPYIASGEIGGLEDEVKRFDPMLALDGGADGLEIYREIAAALAGAAGPALVALEVGDGQAADVEALMRGAIAPCRLGTATTHRDMAGKPRCVAMQLLN